MAFYLFRILKQVSYTHGLTMRVDLCRSDDDLHASLPFLASVSPFFFDNLREYDFVSILAYCFLMRNCVWKGLRELGTASTSTLTKTIV